MTHFCHQMAMAIPGHFTLMTEWDPETPNSLAGVWRNQEATSGWVPPQHLVHGQTREAACWRAKVEDTSLGCSIRQHLTQHCLGCWEGTLLCVPVVPDFRPCGYLLYVTFLSDLMPPGPPFYAPVTKLPGPGSQTLPSEQ